jgi:hypothetical protein
MASITSNEKVTETGDLETQGAEDGIVESSTNPHYLRGILKSLAMAGVEMQGLEPIPVEADSY